MSTLYVLVPVMHQHSNVDWVREQPRLRALTLRQLEKIGITDLEERIRTETVLAPTGWQGKFGLQHGATFIMAHRLNQMLHVRSHNRFEDLAVYISSAVAPTGKRPTGDLRISSHHLSSPA
jgi:phytoene desaturase